MKLNKIAQVLVAAACLTAGAAYANTVSYDSSMILNTDTDLADFLSFQQFNSSMGTLTGVHIDVYSEVIGSVGLSSNSGLSKDVHVSLSVDLDLQRPDTTGIVHLAGASIFDQVVHLAPHGSDGVEANKTVSGFADLSNASDLVLFTGNGTLLAPMYVTATTFSDATNVDADFSTSANGYGKVTYTFTAAPVPEPETYAMLLLGMGVLAGVAKRKSRANKA